MGTMESYSRKEEKREGKGGEREEVKKKKKIFQSPNFTHEEEFI